MKAKKRGKQMTCIFFCAQVFSVLVLVCFLAGCNKDNANMVLQRINNVEYCVPADWHAEVDENSSLYYDTEGRVFLFDVFSPRYAKNMDYISFDDMTKELKLECDRNAEKHSLEDYTSQLYKVNEITFVNYSYYDLVDTEVYHFVCYACPLNKEDVFQFTSRFPIGDKQEKSFCTTICNIVDSVSFE